MSKVYVGNLSQEATEEEVRKLFEQNKVPPLNIAVKDGFAFVEVENQEMVEKAIEKLNDYNLLGSVIVVEPSVPKRRSLFSDSPNRPRSSIIMVHNIPLSVELSVIQNLLSGFGKVVSCSKGREGGNGYSVQVRFENPDEARKAIDDLNKHELEGNTLRVSIHVKYRNNTRQQNGGSNYPNQQRQNLPSDFDFPVRLLVPSDLVGALIGKSGETIRKVTKDTKARVDIHRRENPGSSEKAVTIFGKPDHINAAVKSLMEVMVEENQRKEKGSGDLPLKLLVHNSLVGRLIGKGGKSLKNIMDESNAKITISPMHELTICNPERIVTVYGTVDDCATAEEMITNKLRKAYENYMQANQPQSHNLFPGLNYMGLFAGNDMGPNHMYQPQQPFNNHPMMESNYDEGGYVRQGTLPGLYYPSQPGVYGGPQQRVPQEANVPQSETCVMYIPKESVGPIIGVKGENIRASAKQANASIRISPADSDAATERKVVIKGNAHSQWKAQFAIFDKIRHEGIFGDREVHLCSEITVPGNLVGRIIGKGGNRVRELQRLSGAHIEVPRNETEGGAGDQGKRDENEEVVVKITGHFYANQAAQRRIRQLQQEVLEREAYRRYMRNRGGYNGNGNGGGRGGGFAGRGGARTNGYRNNKRNGRKKSGPEGEDGSDEQ